MKFLHKKNVLIALLVVIVLGVGYRYSYLFIPITEYKNVDEWMAERPRSKGEYINYITELEKAARADDIGGQTPQETLALWVEAVKADNLEKASTYFVITEGKNAFEIMKESKRNNVFPEVIIDIENGGSWSISEYTGARFETHTLEERIKRDGNRGYVFEFTQNKENGVWKIDEF